MQIVDLIMISAVFLGPIVAVRITRYLDDRKEKQQRKLNIFRILMATRAANLAPAHIEALNTIEVEFNQREKKNKKVLSAWRTYLDHLNNRAYPADTWGAKRLELLIELLYEMAIHLNYDFDKTEIKNSSYSPALHNELEDDQTAIRRGFRKLLEGKSVIPMYVVNLPETQHSDDIEVGVKEANKEIKN